MAEDTNLTDKPNDKRFARLGAVIMGLGALLILLALQSTWVVVGTIDERTGGTVVDIEGSTWVSELTALSLVLLAGMVAGLVLRSTGRRVVGTLCSVCAGAALYWPLKTLIVEPDRSRIESVLQYAADTTSGTGGSAPLGEIGGVDVSAFGPILATIGALLAIAGAVTLASKPGGDAATASKYETTSKRKEKVSQDLAEDPESGRVMWDALDADIDPTDMPPTTRG